MKRIILFLFSLTLAVSAAESAKVYVDHAHGGLSGGAKPLESLFQKIGAEFLPGNAPITSEAIAGAKVLYLRSPTKPFTADEKAAVVDFVKKGGSLCLVFDEERRMPLATIGVNDLIEPFGLKLTADTPYLHNCGAIAKAGEINQADREIPYSGGRSVEGGTAFAWQLDAEGKPAQPFAAHKRLENGARIIVMAEGMASIFLGTQQGERLTGVPRDPTKTVYWGKDSAVFMEEVFTWLISAANLPSGWRFVADQWALGRATFGPHVDIKGLSLGALHFSFDGEAQRKQFAETRAAGKSLMTEAMAGRIYDGAHAVLLESKFRDGIIECDICGAGRDDYQGLIFRASPQALRSRIFAGEIIYFRPFFSNQSKPHYPAIQYFATQPDGEFRKMFASRETDPKIPMSEWFHVRVEVRGNEAKVFLNSDAQATMVIPRLASGQSEGLVGFWAWNGRLANLKVTPLQ
jgi:hypothetical protein